MKLKFNFSDGFNRLDIKLAAQKGLTPFSSHSPRIHGIVPLSISKPPIIREAT